jgi:putative hydrolase of the HAD superfamily
MNLKEKQLIIFDLDDTLLDTSNVYWSTRKIFADKTSKELGIQEKDLVEEFERIDGCQMDKLNFSPYRYTYSMILTYKFICQQINHSISSKVLKQIRSYGRRILRDIPNVIEDANNLLEWVAQRYYLGLLTRGDESFQNKKLQVTGLYKYFQFIQIVPYKNAKILEEFIQSTGFKHENIWTVGDSIKSDINPGIKVGIKCILYEYRHPYYSWLQEHEDIAIGSFYKATQMSDIKEILIKNSPVNS